MLMGLLLNLRDTQDEESSREQNRDLRAGCMVDLINFYDKIDRREMYLRYVDRLARENKGAGQYVEAALALKLHAEKLKV